MMKLNLGHILRFGENPVPFFKHLHTDLVAYNSAL